MATTLLEGQGVDAGRGDRLPAAAAGAGAGDEPDEQPGYVPRPMMHPPLPFIPLPWAAAAAGAVADRAPQPGGGTLPDAFAAFLACQQAQAQNGQPGRCTSANRICVVVFTCHARN
jgi:hypothetical protein